jgi:hypothetical protein
MACGALQLSLVALGDRDPLEFPQPLSFLYSSSTPLKNLGQAVLTHTLLSEVSRREMVSGALQLSLVAMGDRDPLEWCQSFSASCSVPAAKHLCPEASLVIHASVSTFSLGVASRKKCSRGNVAPRVLPGHTKMGGLGIYEYCLWLGCTWRAYRCTPL